MSKNLAYKQGSNHIIVTSGFGRKWRCIMNITEDRYSQKPLTMEEYLYKRQLIRAAEEKRPAGKREILKKSSAYKLTELYV